MTEMKLLKKMDLFWGMNEHELKLFCDIAKREKYKAGQIIFQEGDPCDRLYIVLSGLVEINMLVSDDVTQVLGELRPGTQFGEMALIDDAPRSASAKALEETELLTVLRDSFLDLIEHNPTFSAKALINLARTMSSRLRITNNVLRQTMSWNIKLGGMSDLSLASLAKEGRAIQIHLISHERIKGLLLKVEKRDSNYDLVVRDEAGQIFLIPYHAVVSISVEGKCDTAPLFLQ
jgi:CRP-like cAMP-binding protein